MALGLLVGAAVARCPISLCGCGPGSPSVDQISALVARYQHARVADDAPVLCASLYPPRRCPSSVRSLYAPAILAAWEHDTLIAISIRGSAVSGKPIAPPRTPAPIAGLLQNALFSKATGTWKKVI
jgi:hypothetical protein